MKVLSCLAILMAFTWACETPLSKGQEVQVNKIDTLLQVSDSLHQAMTKVNDSLIAEQLPEVESLYKTIAQANPDSADKRFWVQEVNRLELIYSSFSKYLKDKEKIKEELAHSSKQLQALKNSVVDRKLDSAEAAKFLKQEAQALAAANFKFNKRQPNVLIAQRMWDTTQTHFRNMADQIKTQRVKK